MREIKEREQNLANAFFTWLQFIEIWAKSYFITINWDKNNLKILLQHKSSLNVRDVESGLKVRFLGTFNYVSKH